MADPPAAGRLRALAHSVLLHAAALAVLCRSVPPGPAPPREAGLQMILLFAPGAPDRLSEAIIPPSPAMERLNPPAPQILPAFPGANRPALPHPTRTPPDPTAKPRAAPPDMTASSAPSPTRPVQSSPAADAALSGFAATIQRRVQQAAHYPAIARRQARQGRVQLRFTYRAGTVSAAEIVRPSGSALLDQAALAAVRNAAYPPPPGLLGGRPLAMVVWVDFALSSE
jgi:protein TonB